MLNVELSDQRGRESDQNRRGTYIVSRPSCSTICSRFSSTILVGQFNYNTEDQQFLETDSKPLFKPLPKLSP